MSSIDLFNSTLMQLLDELYRITGQKKFKKYFILVKNTIESESERKKFIDQYVINMLQHKDRIYAKDENFFMTYEFDDENNYTTDMYDMRGVLGALTSENKEIVFDYFIALTEFSNNYFISFMKAQK